MPRRHQAAAGNEIGAAQTLTVQIPFVIRTRGGRKLAIAADGTTLVHRSLASTTRSLKRLPVPTAAGSG